MLWYLFSNTFFGRKFDPVVTLYETFFKLFNKAVLSSSNAV